MVEKLLEDKRLVNELFERCGEAEFRFIERSGLYFGFLLGVFQVGRSHSPQAAVPTPRPPSYSPDHRSSP